MLIEIANVIHNEDKAIDCIDVISVRRNGA